MTPAPMMRASARFTDLRSMAGLLASVCSLALFACAAAPPVPPPAVPSAADAGVEAVSLTGQPLTRPILSAELQAARERDLEAARLQYQIDPNDADSLVWIGRRLGYLGRFREAIEAFSEGVRKFPEDARFLRHRGHRYITLRRFDDAIADLQKAAGMVRAQPDQIEPDGLPNARNIPIGSLQSNICYHLGLAHYLKGDFERALPVYRQCAAQASNADRLVSVSHWLYMTLRRLGRAAEAEAVLAPVSSSLDVIENVSYHKLLLMYRGEIAPEELLSDERGGTDRATMLYGIGHWHLYNGEEGRAYEIFRSILASDPWPAFGYIAAEAELSRIPPRQQRPAGSE